MLDNPIDDAQVIDTARRMNYVGKLNGSRNGLYAVPRETTRQTKRF